MVLKAGQTTQDDFTGLVDRHDDVEATVVYRTGDVV
jgi:hypothetical protein